PLPWVTNRADLFQVPCTSHRSAGTCERWPGPASRPHASKTKATPLFSSRADRRSCAGERRGREMQDSKVFGIDVQLSMLYKRQESPSFSSSDSQSKGRCGCVEGEADHNKFIHYHFKSFLEVCYVETNFFISTVAFYR